MEPVLIYNFCSSKWMWGISKSMKNTKFLKSFCYCLSNHEAKLVTTTAVCQQQVNSKGPVLFVTTETHPHLTGSEGPHHAQYSLALQKGRGTSIHILQSGIWSPGPRGHLKVFFQNIFWKTLVIWSNVSTLAEGKAYKHPNSSRKGKGFGAREHLVI